MGIRSGKINCFFLVSRSFSHVCIKIVFATSEWGTYDHHQHPNAILRHEHAFPAHRVLPALKTHEWIGGER